MRNDYAIWDGKNVIPVKDVTDKRFITMWNTPGARRVLETRTNGKYISTVFLGINHAFGDFDEDNELWFETMIFGGEKDEYQRRYSTESAAINGHWSAVKVAGTPAWKIYMFRLRWKVRKLVGSLPLAGGALWGRKKKD